MTEGFTGCPGVPHLVLGGAKSGKSCFAESLIQRFPSPYVYVATAQALDDEMRDRIKDHQRRRGALWQNIEVPLALVEHLHTLRGKGRPVLVDCLTLWLSNLMLESPSSHGPPAGEVDRLCAAIGAADYPLVLVSNEVGGGIVPENALARAFRDLAGRTNQQVAAACTAVTLVVAGLPLVLKESPKPPVP
jgi:adenosylcobinamide kinase / adenosylcobinamide-phosphate guanylyltransferase